MDWVQSAPILHFFGTCWEAAKLIKNTKFLQGFGMLLGDLAASRQVQKWGQKVQNWCPTGS